MRNRFRRNHQEPEIEVEDISNSQRVEQNISETPFPKPEPSSIRVDLENNENSASGVNRQQADQADNAPAENSTRTVRSEEVKTPYSILVGMIILSLFVVSFIVIMVIRGVLHNLPPLFGFFANMYLAGISHAVFGLADLLQELSYLVPILPSVSEC